MFQFCLRAVSYCRAHKPELFSGLPRYAAATAALTGDQVAVEELPSEGRGRQGKHGG
jgi:hypothetical protein